MPAREPPGASLRSLLGRLSRLADDAVGPAVLERVPEGHVGLTLEQVGRQDVLARARAHLGMDLMESANAQLAVEFRRVVVHVLEIVVEGVLADELVNELVTKRLPADAGRFVGVAFDVAKYDVVGDIAACGAEVPPGPETAAPVSLADVGKLLLDFT